MLNLLVAVVSGLAHLLDSHLHSQLLGFQTSGQAYFLSFICELDLKNTRRSWNDGGFSRSF